VLHFGSLASWLPPGDEVVNQRVAELRAAGSVLISYDPNAWPALQGEVAGARAKVRRSAALAHVIKASAEDVGWLYGADDPAPVASEWLGLGAGLVVITDGGRGTTAWVPGLPPVTRPAIPAPVVDTVGAGDAFMSGLLDELARRDLATPRALTRLAELADAATLAAIVDDAALVAAITCSRAGADPPTRAEADAFRDRLRLTS
jgi:fructokinase